MAEAEITTPHRDKIPACRQTHPNFKSFDDSFTKAKDIYSKVGLALNYHHQLLWRVVPSSDIDYFIRRNYRVRCNKIDRLYYASRSIGSYNELIYRLIVRTEYYGKAVYAEIVFLNVLAVKDVSRGNIEGRFFYTTNPILFMRVIDTPYFPRQEAKEMFESDGIEWK